MQNENKNETRTNNLRRRSLNHNIWRANFRHDLTANLTSHRVFRGMNVHIPMEERRITIKHHSSQIFKRQLSYITATQKQATPLDTQLSSTKVNKYDRWPREVFQDNQQATTPAAFIFPQSNIQTRVYIRTTFSFRKISNELKHLSSSPTHILKLTRNGLKPLSLLPPFTTCLNSPEMNSNP